MAVPTPRARASRPRIVVVGASAGGIEPLVALAADLPGGLDAAVFVVVHVPARTESILPKVLNRAGSLAASHAVDGEPIRRGRIYVAPPDFHLLLEERAVRTSHGPKENRSRPAIDPLFRSAASAHGDRVIGVILSGSLDDGAGGLAEVRRHGGLAVIQDPEDAMYPSMPAAAIREAGADHVVAARDLAATVERLVNEPTRVRLAPIPESGDGDASTAETLRLQLGASIRDGARHGSPASFGCPDCGGTLWQLEEGNVLTFRCRVGHSYTPRNLLDGQSTNVETGLWQAVRALEEQASLASRLSVRAVEEGHPGSADRFSEQARRAREQAGMVRDLIFAGSAVQELDVDEMSASIEGPGA